MKRLLKQCAVALGACLILAVVLMTQAQARNPRGAVSGSPFIGSCPVTVGTLTLAATTPRSTGISPLLVFFDATGTTDSATLTGANNPFQDISYTWNFGDGGTSGTSTWAYGSNPGVNSRNTATGAIAAHLYITSGADAPYTATVTANDGTNTAQCNVVVTAYDPEGSNGFSGTATKCVSSSGTPVAGSAGCPAGASVLNATSAATATASLSGGKRVLLKCGDSFTGNTTSITNAKGSLGAYGSCPGVAITSGNQANYPQVGGTVFVDTQSSDVRVSDLVINSGGNRAVDIANAYDPPYTATTQITLWNLYSNATNQSYYPAQTAQSGFIQLVQTGMGVNQGTFLNFAENNCTNGSNTWSGCAGSFVGNDYNALMGGSFNGVGAPNNGSGIEAVRISGGSKWVISDNTIQNANNVGGVFKMHSGNTKNSDCEWIGKTDVYEEISDNLFPGGSGAEVSDVGAQNQTVDERMQYMVIERNLFAPSTSGHQLLLVVMNATVRDNVFYNSGLSVGNRGYQGTSNNTVAQPCAGSGTTGAPTIPLFPTGDEVYNNTFDGGGGPAFGGSNGITAPANNGFIANSLLFGSSGITNTGSGNTVGNNTATRTNDPAFTNGSTTFSLISDFKPTAFYTLTNTPVPVFYDAVGVAWSPTWDLGAVHH